MLCRRILHNHSIIPPTAYSLLPRSTTRSSILKHAIFIPFARTKSFQLSFFISVCHLWNHLPLPITCCPVLVCSNYLFYVCITNCLSSDLLLLFILSALSCTLFFFNSLALYFVISTALIYLVGHLLFSIWLLF